MKLQKTPIALACALAAAAPFAAQAAPTVSFKTPTSGQTVSGNIYQSSACEAVGTNIDRVKFYLDATLLNTEENAPWNCNLDTRKFSNGTHTLKAVAYDSAGVSATRSISVNIQNGTTTTNTPPSVSITSPASGTTVKGTAVTCAASASDTNGIKQVQFFLDGTALQTDTTSPYNCSFDSTKFANGNHVLKAVATDGLGATSSTQITVAINNTTTSTTTLPVSGSGTLNIWAKNPVKGQTVSGLLQGATCYVNGTGVSRVEFFLDSTPLNVDSVMSDGMSCVLDTTKFPNGAHMLNAIAYSSTGAKYVEPINITINNPTTTPTTPPANVAPTVSFASPASGGTLTGTAAGFAATAADSDGTVAKVEIYVDATLVATKTSAPYSGTIDSTKFTNGTHALKAVATDNAGAATTSQISVTVNNTTVSNPTTPTSSLPSTGTKAITTFESIGLYWTPPSAPSNGKCEIQYKKVGDSSWSQGYPMWYDSRNSECRGSIVHAAPGTDYEVQFALPGQSPVAGLVASTWSDNFPIAQTVYVTDRNTPLTITQGGTANGYVLYTPAPGTSATIDVQNAYDNAVVISAPYVIIRGLTITGGKRNGVRMNYPARDVVIEDNDIHTWGSWNGNTSTEGWKIQTMEDSGIYAMCNTNGQWLQRITIQRNKIHDPRYGSNSWTDGHPVGANAVFFYQCGGNHVMRYNDIYASSEARWFMDGLGGSENFSSIGFPNSDTDIYGNKITNARDDAIESEGANRNVRIWGNYADLTLTAVATTTSDAGPVYVFRNVWNRNRHYTNRSWDTDDRVGFNKAGTVSGYGGGRRFVFHNTMLQAQPPAGSGLTQTMGGGEGLSGPNSTQILTNTVSRNNIWHVWKSGWNSIDTKGGSGNDLDNDLLNGNVTGGTGLEPNRIVGVPTYAAGNGWQSESGGMYQLAPSSLGYGKGVRLPNFNDGSAAPDVGAHQSGTAAMRFGVSGAGSSWAGPSGTSSGTTSSTGSTTTSSSGGVCSTAVCVVTQ